MGFQEISYKKFDEIRVKEDIPYTFEPIQASWAWAFKYLDEDDYMIQGPSRSWKGVGVPQCSTGIYGISGGGKTFLHYMLLEVSKLAGHINIIIDDKKLESAGFLLPTDKEMLNSPFFPNFEDGTFPILPRGMPREDIRFIFPVTNKAFVDEFVEELMEWGIVDFIKFNPNIMIRNPWVMSAITGATKFEKDAYDVAIAEYEEELRQEGKTADDFDVNRVIQISGEQPWIKRSNPMGKLAILQRTGLFTKQESFVMHKSNDEIDDGKAIILSNMKKYLTPPAKPSRSKIYVFSTRTLASPSIPDTSPFIANLMLFILTREGCWRGYNTKGRRRCPVFTHLPEAGAQLQPKSTIKAINTIANDFVGTYEMAAMQDRLYRLYHILNTQIAQTISTSITGNQYSMFFTPGIKSPSELNWIKEGAGMVFDENNIRYILSQISERETNRGKALWIQGRPRKVSLRPRVTKHFEETEEPVFILKEFREKYGFDYNSPWVRWDSS